MGSVQEAKSRLNEWRRKLEEAKRETKWWEDELKIREEKERNTNNKK